MNRCFRILATGSLALLFALTFVLNVQAQQGVTSGLGAQGLLGPQVAFTNLYSSTEPGDYVAAGVGLRNSGSGVINLAVPAGATIEKAWMFWAVIWEGAPPASTATLNSNNLSGTFIGTSGSPCWGGDGINFYYADVTNYVQTGANNVSNIPSANPNYPLAEGASIVAVFNHPAWDYNDISVSIGTQSFNFATLTSNFGSYTGWNSGNPADQTAQTTFIVADGQGGSGAGDGTRFNGTPTSGPGTAIMTNDAFPGADGALWDTHNLNVSSFFANGVNTAANASVAAGLFISFSDCLTWGAQVVSVKSAINAFIDVKAKSCPNSVNVASKGVLPVAIVGTSWFDVTDVDVSTVQLNGVSAFGNTVIQDSTKPYMGFPSGCYDCNTGGSDGYDDLVLKFKMKDVVPTLSSITNGDCVEVTVTGNLNDGTPFSGTDVLRIINNHSPKDGRGIAGFELALEQNAPNPVVTATSFQYTLPTASDVRLEIFNTLGQLVARVVDGNRSAGVHTATWDGLSSSGTPLTPGSYIYRLSAGEQVMSKMLIIAR